MSDDDSKLLTALVVRNGVTTEYECTEFMIDHGVLIMYTPKGLIAFSPGNWDEIYEQS